MNYLAPSRNLPQREQRLTLRDILNELWEVLNKFYQLAIEFPQLVLDQLGLSFIPDFLSISLPACACCICIAFLAMTTSVGIGLGVGLGVGLNCPKSIINFQNGSNITSDNSTNSTLG